jgi:hypothetical protein
VRTHASRSACVAYLKAELDARDRELQRLDVDLQTERDMRIGAVEGHRSTLSARDRELVDLRKVRSKWPTTVECARRKKAEADLADAREALLALAGGYQRDQLSAAIWRAVDAALSAGKESR